MNDQAKHIYKKLESESIVNEDTIKKEIEADILDINNLEEDKINLYHKKLQIRYKRTVWLYYKWNNGQCSVM